MNDNSQIFGTKAKVYRAGRVHYPSELFEWITSQCKRTACALDVATGSGQAAVSLADHFDQVIATDISEGQIAEAEARDNIRYTIAPAEASGLPDTSVDAVVVATALHWFDFDRFWPEVQRVCRPGAIFCGFTTGLIDAEEEVASQMLRPIFDAIDPYWAEGNRLAMRGYPADEIRCPFQPLSPPDFSLTVAWTPERLRALIHSWSAHMRALDEGKGDELNAIETEAMNKLGPSPRRFRFPFHVVAHRVA